MLHARRCVIANSRQATDWERLATQAVVLPQHKAFTRLQDVVVGDTFKQAAQAHKIIGAQLVHELIRMQAYVPTGCSRLPWLLGRILGVTVQRNVVQAH